MATLERLEVVLRDILDTAQRIEAKDRIAAKSINAPGGLSDITNFLGTITAGEFRTGNGADPGKGFSGVRIAYPGMSYASSLWNVVGVSNDVMQFGLRATDGVAIFGGSNVQLDSSGVTLVSGAQTTNYVKWQTVLGTSGYITGHIYSYLAGITDQPQTWVQSGNASQSQGWDNAVTGLIARSKDDVDAVGNTTYAAISANDDGSANLFRVYADINNVLRYYFNIVMAESVFNTEGGDINLRVEGDTDVNLLFVDAGADKVGIGDAAPGEKLDVAGNINVTGVVKIDDVQVVSNRVVDARCDDVCNSGDATTDGVIDALRDAMITHGLIAAA